MNEAVGIPHSSEPVLDWVGQLLVRVRGGNEKCWRMSKFLLLENSRLKTIWPWSIHSTSVNFFLSHSENVTAKYFVYLITGGINQELSIQQEMIKVSELSSIFVDNVKPKGIWYEWYQQSDYSILLRYLLLPLREADHWDSLFWLITQGSFILLLFICSENYSFYYP